MSSICTNYQPKKIQLYIGTTMFHTYKNDEGNLLTDAGLDSSLNYLSELNSNNPTYTPTSEEIKTESDYILSNNKGRLLKTYYKDGVDSAPGNYIDLSTLQKDLASPDYINYKVVVLLVFTKEKPSVKIVYPENQQTVFTKTIEGTATGIDSISSVYVCINKNNWLKADGTKNWKIEVPLNFSKNTIEAFAIDNYNDTSEVEMISDVVYKELLPPEVTLISPGLSKNVVVKCLRSKEYSYKFILTVDSLINIKNLSIVVEDKDTVQVGKISLGQLPDDAILKNSYYNNYCVFINYNITGAPDVCSIMVEDDYYFRLIYNGKEKVKLPERFKVHFSSFNTEFNQHEPCNCE